MHAYLQDQAIGMVQVESLAVFDANGILMANSVIADPPELRIDVVNDPAFRSLRQGRGPQLSIAAARPALFKPETWVFPIARRLETPGGAFAGVVFAGGRVEYFEQFYRDLRLDDGTAVTLLHRDGTLLARHPSAPAALGQRYAAIDDLMMAGTDPAERTAPRGQPDRRRRPLRRRRGHARLPAGGGRDARRYRRAACLARAGHRHVTHTLVLGLLSALLLAMVARQFARLDQTRASLEHSRERFALAAAGSDVGIWDWDVAGDRVYASARAREIFGLPPGPEIQPREAWFATVRMHPDDVDARRAAMQAHLDGKSPVYAGEYRVRDADGELPLDPRARPVRARRAAVRRCAWPGR